MRAVIGRVRGWLAFPPQVGESDAARIVRLLDLCLVVSTAVTAVFLLATWTGTGRTARLLTGLVIAAFLVLGRLSHLGFPRFAAAAYLAVVWLYVTLSFWLFGGWRTPAASAYTVVALAAALLFGVRGASAVSALIVATCAFMAFADTRGWPPAPPLPGMWVTLGVLLASLLIVVGLALYATAELRRAIAGLRESEGRFRSIIESSPMGIVLYRLDPEDRLVLTGSNSAADRILGIEVGRLVGLTIEEAFSGLVGTVVPAAYRRVCAEGGSWTSEVPYRDERFEGYFDVHAFQTEPGKVAVLFLDVTERRRAEEDRRRLEEQLRQSQKMEAVGRLAGGIAHDFNNLLMVIMGHGELLRRSFEADDTRLRKVQHVMGAAERAARLVRQLLAFSRKQVLEPRTVDLNALVSDTARMLRPLLGEDVEVVTRLDPGLGHVRVDPAQIDQVLVNLAVNARDAMPGGGTLFLETAEVEPAEEVLPGPQAALTVRDTGHGMDEGTRARAFEPFFTTKGASGGSGLGLSMVYGIVQQSGGHIALESEPGRGSSFRILLPRAEAPDPPPEAGHAPAPGSKGGETVLVVEDEPAIRSLACEMLEAHGYRAIGAGSGEEALGLAVRHPGPIDLLVTDVVMPGLAGPALADRFRLVRPGTRVLFISGYEGDDLVRRGMSDVLFLPKPFTADVLGRRVREALDR